MQRTAIVWIVLLSLVLSSCGTLEISLDVTSTAGAPGSASTPEPAAPVLSMESTSEQIQQAMIQSAMRWKTIWMDGTVTRYAQDGSGTTQVYREQAWIEQDSSRFRVVLSSMNSDSPETFKACDGINILEMNLLTGENSSHSLPEFAKAGQYVPPLEEGTAYPNPLWGQIGTPISEIAFSANFAQNKGTFKPLSVESVADRETLVVEWTYVESTTPQWRLWLDSETAVILKLQEFGKGGGTDLQGERVVNQIVYDASFDSSLFGIPAEAPQFGDVSGRAANPVELAAATPSAPDALGQVYFFTLPHQAGQSAQLVRLPGSCVVGLVQCPQLENISVPFPFHFSLSPLSWSLDGKLAAFAYADDPNGTPTKLWLFDPAADTWSSLAEFPFIDPPFWSPDGMWIAFRVQDGLGSEDVYAIHRDRTDLKNLTATGKLPQEGRPYVMDGWFTENIIVRSGLPGSTGGVYLMRVSDGFVRPIFETHLTKAAFVPSPDNAWFAYDDFDYSSQKHVIKVTEPDGAHPVEVVSFAGGSVYPIVWSPDARQLAFAHSSTDASFNPLSDVYVIGRDGRGMRQVYKGTTVGRVLFSPDGKYLLVEETTSATGGHLFVINLDTLEQKIISAPGLSLDTDWYAPSWRP